MYLKRSQTEWMRCHYNPSNLGLTYVWLVKNYNRIKRGLFECDFKLEGNGLERQQINKILTSYSADKCWQIAFPERRSVSFKNKLKAGFVQRSSVFSSVTQQFGSKHYMNSQNYQLLIFTLQLATWSSNTTAHCAVSQCQTKYVWCAR